MKKLTQTKLAPFYSKLPDGSMVHGLGTYRPPPVHTIDRSVHIVGTTIGDGVVLNINNEGSNTTTINPSDTSNLPSKRFGPPSKKRISDNTRNVANATNSHVSAINDEHRKKRKIKHVDDSTHVTDDANLRHNDVHDDVHDDAHDDVHDDVHDDEHDYVHDVADDDTDDDVDDDVHDDAHGGNVIKNVANRYNYTTHDIQSILSMWKLFMDKGLSRNKAIKRLRKEKSEWSGLSKKSIDRWIKKEQEGSKVAGKRGKKTVDEFLHMVLKKLRFRAVFKAVNDAKKRQVDKTEKIKSLVNAVYSYDIVEMAATKSKEVYLNGDADVDSKKIVKALKFSAHWVSDFLDRFSLHRKKITTTFDRNKIPSDEEIAVTMATIASLTQDVPLTNILSADETGINWDKSLRHQYVRDGEIPENTGDAKLRFTAMIHASAAGVTGPPCKSIPLTLF